jgi:small subunit ribosomal protein S27Ae
MPRSDFYADGEATRERCPRCGDTFLADHDDRQHCGACGYTEWE